MPRHVTASINRTREDSIWSRTTETATKTGGRIRKISLKGETVSGLGVSEFNELNSAHVFLLLSLIGFNFVGQKHQLSCNRRQQQQTNVEFYFKLRHE